MLFKFLLADIGAVHQALDSHLGMPLGDSPSQEHVAVQAESMGKEHQTASWNFAIDPLTGATLKHTAPYPDHLLKALCTSQTMTT